MRTLVLRAITLLCTVFLLAAPAAQAATLRVPLAGKPVSGGSLAIRDIFGSTCNDPINPDSGGTAMLIGDPLISVDLRGRYQPSLALKWKFSTNGKALDLTLRRGVRFSNGHPFNARALKQNFDYLLKQPAGLAPLAGVKVTGPYSVELRYGAPFRPALDALTVMTPVDITAEHAPGADPCKFPVGTGPYLVKSVGPNFDPVVLVRNRYHTWEPPWLHNHGLPYVSTVTVKSVVDDTQATSELLSGDLDLARVAPAQLPRLRHQSGIALHRFPDADTIFFGFNHSHAPFNNTAVRRALAEAIDRKALIKVAYGGLGKVQNSIVPQTDPYYDAGAGKDLPAYNPTQAAQVLKANHVTGPFTLETYTIPVFAATAQFIQAELANVGVKVNLAIKDVADAQSDMGKGLMDMYVDIWSGNDLYPILHSSQTPQTGAHNWNFLHDPKLDRLIVQARTTVKPRAARAVLNQEQSYLNRKAVVVPLFARELVGATRTRVHDYRYVPGSNTYMWPAIEDLYVTK